ncbi:acetyl-CoA synthetase-like protein [Apodospora peruviana]|uniref:Acetyl-CoA synthetase-like protein n=1 Tax=Apodospora peruviana TaxID=516989 RepID=A0AAE0ITC6_9PEZI|nr:acetyl-CoA synthetase-like protein [Apodospora peruviana]
MLLLLQSQPVPTGCRLTRYGYGIPRQVARTLSSCLRGVRNNHARVPFRPNAQQARTLIAGELSRSLAQGPDEPPLLLTTIPEHFAAVVSRYGDHNAVICRSPAAGPDAFASVRRSQEGPTAALETVFTYEKLDLVSNTLAHSLRSLGIKKGDRVAVSLGNCPEFAALSYAIFKLGAILVPLNPGFNAKQVSAALNHLAVQVLIIGAVTDLAYKPCRGRSNLSLLKSTIPDLESGKIEAPHVPTLSTVVVVDNTCSHPDIPFPPLVSLRSLTPFTQLLLAEQSNTVIPDSPLSPSETINIQFTSGTTSQPKAAMLSHTSILNNGALIAHRMGLDPTDRIVCPPPLFHCFGSVLGYMATATTGAAILFPSPAFDPLASLRMAADHRATGLYGVATMFVAMLELVASQSLLSSPLIPPEQTRAYPEHLRKGIAAGSSVPESLMRRLYRTLGLNELVICYGMTETSPVSCMTAPHDPFDKRTGSVGRVMPHTKVKVVDPTDRTKVLPVGERGELAAAGYLVMQGYWGDEARTQEARIADEEGGEVWMYSGDEACMDAEGYVEITGRIKDLIIRGGENIHPLEIENCLFQHPLVSEASVVGVPDARYGESVGVFVIVHKGVEAVEGEIAMGEERALESAAKGVAEGKKLLTKGQVRDWVREHLSDHLVPKHVFWVDEYPKTASGKIQKFKLRDLARELITAESTSSPGGGKNK